MAKGPRKSRKRTASIADLLPGLVADWGGFERFVADLNQTAEDVVVEHDVTLIDTDGVRRKIDVVLRYRQGLVDHLVLVECKYWKRNVPREKVDAFANTIVKLKASHGIMFSAVGFQSGAIQAVKSLPIILFKVREPTPGEWGAPGRYIDIYLVVAFIAAGQVTFPGVGSTVPVADPNIRLDMRIGGETATATEAVLGDGTRTTLEKLIEERARAVARQMYAIEVSKGVPFFPERGQRRICSTGMTFFPVPLRLVEMPNIVISCISFPVGLNFIQTRIKTDRAVNYTFVVAVENCVTNGVTAAARRLGDAITTMFPLEPKIDPEDVIQNGSVITVWTSGFQPFSDFERLTQGVAEDTDYPDQPQAKGS